MEWRAAPTTSIRSTLGTPASMSWKFGFTLRRDCCRRNNPEAPNIAYSSRADFINNIPNSVGPTYGNGDYTAKMYQVGGFAQTDWRVRRRPHPEPRDSLRLLLPPGSGGERARRR